MSGFETRAGVDRYYFGQISSWSEEVARLLSAEEQSVSSRKHWTRRDASSFIAAILLESGIEGLDKVVSWPLGSVDQSDLRTSIQTYQAALPFHDPEQRWLVTVFDAAEQSGVVGVADKQPIIRGATTELLIAGQVEEVQGRELMDRWWDWRRGLGDFEGTPSLTIAIDALRDMEQQTKSVS